MLGWIRFEHRRRLRLEREDLLGLPVWALRLPKRAWGLERRLAKGARRLVSQGVTRVLVPPGFAWWSVLEKCGLHPVDPGALRTALVPLWTGHVLAQKGIPPEQATVALTGPRETQARPAARSREKLSSGFKGSSSPPSDPEPAGSRGRAGVEIPPPGAG